MSKIRVYELAREMKIESKLLMNTLKSIGITLPSHQSMLSDDQVVQLRKAISGESHKSGSTRNGSESGAAGASGSVTRRSISGGDTSTVKVIRRRRPGETEDGQAASAPVVEEAQSATLAPIVDATPSEQEKSPKVGEKSEVSLSIETKAKEPGSTPTTKAEQPLVNEVVAAQAAPTPIIATPTPPIHTGSHDSAMKRTMVPGPRPDDRRRPMSSGGATIVRKATAEEIQARNNPPPSSGTSSSSGAAGRRGVRREDSKGTKYTGYGIAADPSAVVPVIEEIGGELGRAARREVNKDKQRVEIEPEEAAPKKVVTKGVAGPTRINTRLLLNQIEETDRDLDDLPLPLIAPEDTAAEDAANAKAKTVYTPTVAQRRRDLKRRKDLKRTEITVSRASYRVVEMEDTITIGDLAHQLKIKAGDIIKKLMDQGMMLTINQTIDLDTATLIASEYGHEMKSLVKTIDDVLGKNEDKAAKETQKGLESRSPIVTVMGHVDHGKTSILDAIRKTDVAAGEAGGITQHIGAYSVMHGDKKITFLDTPGHEAFSSMRARGANLTDIVILVVAADDGVMPQTVEAIAHAKEAKVPIIVAVNKIDKETANIDRIFRELSEKEVISEEWGGDTQFVKVSALKKIGIDELLEAIILQAEVLELKTDSSLPADGVVVEAHLDAGRGPIATVLVKHGSLKNGDYIVAGTVFGRVRAMNDQRGKKVDVAGPSTPVEVLGFTSVPMAGDRATVVKDERTAREATSWMIEKQRNKVSKSTVQTLEDLLGKIKTAETPELPVILKADTQGSLEAIAESIVKLNSDRVRARPVHRAVGGISESDIALAEASGAAIIGFNVRAARGLDDSAEKRGVVIKYFSIIYDLVDAVKDLMAGKLPSIVEEVVIGRAEVRQPFQVPKIGLIAGSAVVDGRISRNAGVRLIRDDIVLYTGKISSLRRFKDDVKEVKQGFECGIGIENYNDIHIGDVIEAYETKETRPTL